MRNLDLAARLKAILASRGLSLRQVSQIAEHLYGKYSPFFLPHNFYFELGLRTFTPSLQQIFALSRISNYKLADWLCVFGFDLADITRLEILLSCKHTVLLDSSLDDLNGWIPWFEGKTVKVPITGIAPITRLLEYSVPRRVADLSEINNHNFLYARLGRLDLFAFPDLLPGSIVRVNPNWQRLLRITQNISDQFFLIEHSQGLCCCRLQACRANTLIPISTQLPYPQIELRIPEEASVLGLVDAEIRPVPILESADVPQSLSRHWKPEMRIAPRRTLGALLRVWRESRPEVTIKTAISGSLGQTNETADLTIYRVVQESLTNVFRHADATSVNVTIEPAGQGQGSQRGRQCARVRVQDDGRGLVPGHKLGLGLTGMRERILALGGTLSVASGDQGVTVEAIIPNG